jgi:hypothetical protein
LLLAPGTLRILFVPRVLVMGTPEGIFVPRKPFLRVLGTKRALFVPVSPVLGTLEAVFVPRRAFPWVSGTLRTHFVPRELRAGTLEQLFVPAGDAFTPVGNKSLQKKNTFANNGNTFTIL